MPWPKKKGTKWQIIVIYMWLQNHICWGAMGCYRKWPWPEVTSPEVTSPKAALTWNDVSRDRKMLWPEPEVFACACATGTFCTTTMATGSDRRSRDLQWVPLGVRMPTGKLRNICPSGAFWLEVTLWNVTRSDQKSPEGGGRVCACATGSCTISALVGPFHRKWRHQTSPISVY